MSGDLPESGSPSEFQEFSGHLRDLAMRLVRDESSADDVVQEAWLAALDRPEQVRDMNAWLAQVVRNLARRSHGRERRRRELEELSSLPPEGMESIEEVERRSTGELLREAIGELGEPYHSVVSMRYLDEVSVERIAERSDRSAATVRSQLSRGLDQLREILDRRHAGDRSAWCGVLVSSLGFEPAGVSGPPAGNVPPDPAALAPASGLRSIGAWALALLSITTLALWRPWFTPSTPSTDPRSASAPSTLEPPDPGKAPDPVEGPDPVAMETIGTETSERAAVAIEPDGVTVEGAVASSTRRLEVGVRHEDGSPAGKILAIVHGARGPWHLQGEGTFTIDLPPEDLIGPPTVPGPDGGVKIMVRPEGDAWSYAYIVAVPAEGRTIVLPSRGPSLTLEGRIEDELGTPVDEAMIVHRPTLQGTRTNADGLLFGETAIEGYSDEDGNYLLEGLARTKHRIVASAPGLVPTRFTAGDEDSSHLKRDIVLRLGAVVVGIVTGPDGEPVPGARVWQPQYGKQDEHGVLPETRAVEDGSFEVAGLEPGLHRLYAAHPEQEGLFAEGVLEVPAEDVVYWDPQLLPAEGLHARIVDERGVPLGRASVALFVTDSNPAWGDLLTTDAGGRVHFPHVPDVEDLALVAGRSAAMTGLETLRNVQPGPHVYTLRLDGEDEGATLLGRLLDASGVPLENAFLTCQSARASIDFGCDPRTGTFEEHGIEPGSYELWAQAPGRGTFSLGNHQVLVGERLDLGDHRAPASGRVRLGWSTPPSPEAAWVLQTLRPEGSSVPEKDLLLMDRARKELELFAGTYRLVPSTDLNSPRSGEVLVVPFEVQAGEVTQVEVP